jgi:hypothetical protein
VELMAKDPNQDEEQDIRKIKGQLEVDYGNFKSLATWSCTKLILVERRELSEKKFNRDV